MHRMKKPLLIALLLGALALVVSAEHVERIIWVDADMDNIAAPSVRHTTFAENVINAEFLEQGKRATDVIRWLRFATGNRKPASNTNALDEVATSSWYTNRLYLHGMSRDELIRGPNRTEAPDLTGAVITKMKFEGVTPGFHVKDKKGDEYLLKFDPEGYPELQSGAEVISTKILYAAGYNVPQNYIAFLDPNHVEIAPELMSGKSGKNALTHDKLLQMLKKTPQMPAGRYRVLASRILEGEAKGPFPYIGIRRDDPNDRVPHENRRELRGLRVIASWINHWDLKEEQTLDMYVEENGRKFLRHYLIDFGSSLGGDQTPTAYFNGREYGLDAQTIFKELFSLGIYTAPSEKVARIVSPSVGSYTTEDFDPGSFRPTVPMMPFANMTDSDAFWATRVMLSFTEPDIRSIAETAQYTNPKDTDYMVSTLLARQRIVAQYWLPKSDSLSGFTVQPAPGGFTLGFHDLMLDHRLAEADSIRYEYEIRGDGSSSGKKTTGSPSILLQKPDVRDGKDVEVTIRTVRHDHASSPVKVMVQFSPTGQPRIARVTRG